MNTFGPYVINPYQINTGAFDANSIEIPLQLSAGALFEVLNWSNFFVKISLQARGSVIQDPLSKICYRAVQGAFGTQMLSIRIDNIFATQFAPVAPLLQPLQEQHNSPNVGSTLWVNTYEEGEIDWYPPTALQQQQPSGTTNFCRGSGAAGFTVSVPTTGTRYQGIARPVSYITGFDLTSQQGASAAGGQILTIQNLLAQDDGSTQIRYHGDVSTTDGIEPLIVRFPAPLINDPSSNTQVQFVVANTGGAFFNLTVYYFLY